uniref:Uncharacterized protein n=1 Tax=Panagrolaimus sp. ES5 TaxID=591445 RepID=A0AC34GNM7_9BILA
MPVAANRQVVNDALLSEIEANSIIKCLQKAVDELETSPKDYKNFRHLYLAEYNVRVLAEDYMEKVQKNLIPKNELTYKTATRFASNRTAIDVIKDAEKESLKQPNKLSNERYAEMLIKTAKDCVDSAYMLAFFRKTLRENATFERILDNQDEMKQGINLLVHNMHLNNQQPPPPPVAAAVATIPFQNAEQNNFLPRLETAPTCASGRQNALPSLNTVPPPARINAERPSWIVPENQCRNIYNSNLTAETFTRAYLLQLFNRCELMLPLKSITMEKKTEFLLVARHFFQNSGTDWEHTFEKVMKNLRFQKRQNVFKNLNENIGYGVTSDEIDFYFTVPWNNQSQCYSHKDCSVGSRLAATRLCGNFRIPAKCGNSFEFILLTEKSGRVSNVRKLMQNGQMMSIQN